MILDSPKGPNELRGKMVTAEADHAFKFAENTGQMAPIREQAGTFADSIKLWSAA